MENEAIRSRRLFFGMVAGAVAGVVAPKPAGHVGIDLASGKDRTAFYRAMLVNGTMTVNDIRKAEGLPPAGSGSGFPVA